MPTISNALFDARLAGITQPVGSLARTASIEATPLITPNEYIRYSVTNSTLGISFDISYEELNSQDIVDEYTRNALGVRQAIYEVKEISDQLGVLFTDQNWYDMDETMWTGIFRMFKSFRRIAGMVPFTGWTEVNPLDAPVLSWSYTRDATDTNVVTLDPSATTNVRSLSYLGWILHDGTYKTSDGITPLVHTFTGAYADVPGFCTLVAIDANGEFYSSRQLVVPGSAIVVDIDLAVSDTTPAENTASATTVTATITHKGGDDLTTTYLTNFNVLGLSGTFFALGSQTETEGTAAGTIDDLILPVTSFTGNQLDPLDAVTWAMILDTNAVQAGNLDIANMQLEGGAGDIYDFDDLSAGPIARAANFEVSDTIFITV